MSAYTDLDLASPEIKRRGRKLQNDLSVFADDARARLDVARERGMELAHTAREKAAVGARVAADHVRAKPVSTGLIVAVVGIGLFFLLSRSARSQAVAYGEDIWNRYGRR